jgi:hypothetical protein
MSGLSETALWFAVMVFVTQPGMHRMRGSDMQ